MFQSKTAFTLHVLIQIVETPLGSFQGDEEVTHFKEDNAADPWSAQRILCGHITLGQSQLTLSALFLDSLCLITV